MQRERRVGQFAAPVVTLHPERRSVVGAICDRARPGRHRAPCQRVWLGDAEPSASDPDVILAVGAWPRPAVYRSTDGGLSWSTQVRDVAAISLLIVSSDPKKAWMATYTGIFYSSDGETWNQTFKGPQYISDLALSAADPEHPYAAGADGLLPGQGYVFRWGSCELDCSYSRWIPYPVSGSSLIRTLAVNPPFASTTSVPLDRAGAGVVTTVSG